MRRGQNQRREGSGLAREHILALCLARAFVKDSGLLGVWAELKLPIAQQIRMGEVQPRPVMTPEAQAVLEQRVAAWAQPPKHHLDAPPAALSGLP